MIPLMDDAIRGRNRGKMSLLGMVEENCVYKEDISDKRAQGDWNLNELKQTLFRAIESSSDDYCIFLDGLDEAKELERLPWRDKGNAQVVNDLRYLNNVKVCASSREEHPFCLFFDKTPRLRIHLLTYNDIYSFAKGRLESCGLDSSCRAEIQQTVVNKADGVFLWVVLVLDSLNRAISSGTVYATELEERLAQTPADLNDLLVDMWERPGDDTKLPSYTNEVSRYFSLAVTANKLEEDLEDYSPFCDQSMKSLLVMAAALEEEPVASILDTGRYTQANELQARCARVADRLRLVSRGLLEITSYLEPDVLDGNLQLVQFDTKRADFIHRSAFDFITDTHFGRECPKLLYQHA